MRLADELRNIILEESRAKAAKNQLIDSAFPPPEPHVLILEADDRPSIPFVDTMSGGPA